MYCYETFEHFYGDPVEPDILFLSNAKSVAGG